MPPRHKETRVEKELRKSLDTANKIIQEQQPKIGDLETKVASRDEQIATLEEKLAGYPVLKLERENLARDLHVFKAELEKERAGRKADGLALVEKLREMARDLSTQQAEIFAGNKRFRQVAEENITLRAALKKVL